MLNNKNKAFSIFYFILGLILFLPSPSYADCTSPAGPAGRIDYTSGASEQVFKYCNGTDWIPWAGEPLSGIPAPQYSSGSLSADSVFESHLRAVNSATDEYCLTYETTTGDFEWQTCGGGGTPAGADTQIQFNDNGAFGASANLVYNSANHQIIMNNVGPNDGIYLYDSDGDELVEIYNWTGHGLINVSDSNGLSRFTMRGQAGDSRFDSIFVDYDQDRNVGINESSAEARLEISGNASTTYPLFMLSSDDNTDGDIFFVSAGGEVGIGNPAPAVSLDIAGLMRAIDDAAACTATERGAIRFNSAGAAMELCDGSAWAALGGGGGTPAGADREIQFNSGGAFGTTNTFKLMADGDLLLSGTYTGTASVPATGAGTRMFFDTQKAAFRAGYVDGAQWDNANIGDYSTAIGHMTTANGYSATAIGRYSIASGDTSTAMGILATASGYASTAMGGSTTASGAWAMATGSSTTAAGNYSLAAGKEVNVTATGDGSFGFGLTTASPAADPQVSGAQSFGIFMGNHSGVNFSAANTMGLFGGKLVIDSTVPATNLAADTELEIDGTLKIGYGGEACDAAREGALYYDSAGDKFYGCNTAGAWTELGGGIAAALDDLTDVNVPAPSDGLPLIYSSASGQWVQAACDDVPNGLVFVDRTGMAQSVLVESNIILISGVTCSNVPVTVSGDGTPEYRVCATSNCSSVISNWTVANGTIQSGQYLQLRLTTNGSLDTVHTATVTVGSASDNWSVKTIGPQRVFVTSGTYTGNLGGLSGADSSCQALADAAGLVGTFKAWLSDGTTSAASRLTHSTLDYVLVNGTVVANGWNDLTDGTLDAPIIRTQTGAPLANGVPWTNTTLSGDIKGSAHCLNWTSNQGAEAGHYGDSDLSTVLWTDSSSTVCNFGGRLYCFEQDTGPPPGGGGGPGSGGGSAAGSDGEVQFNSGNYLATDPNFVFTSAGRLGVGTPNPQAPLEVAGEIKFSSTGLACSALTEGAQRYDTVTQAVEYCDGATWGAVGGGTPAGADREIQFNSGGAFGTTNTFKLMADGDLLLSGTYTGTASVPVTGAGTRMFFDTQKAAFRAGMVSGTQWDNANIGNRSAAMGYNTTASGSYSTAIGSVTTASGQASTAMGFGSIASGQWATAIGYEATTGGDYSLAVGQKIDVTATGDSSIGFGLTTAYPATAPQVSGAQSFGIFMGNHSGVNFAAANTMGLFGGKLIIDPTIPATKLSTTVALDVVGDINYTGVIVDVSDIRLKDNIQPLRSPLAKLTSLNGFSFEMKNDPKHQVEYGVAAQDVQKVFPELVHQVDENGTLGVAYDGLIAPMIEAIKELKAENEMLKGRLEVLEQHQQIREQ